MGDVYPLLPRRKKGLTDLERLIQAIEHRCDGKRDFMVRRFADLADLICGLAEQDVEASLAGTPLPPVPEGLAECLSDLAPAFADAGVRLPEDPRDAAWSVLSMHWPYVDGKRKPRL